MEKKYRRRKYLIDPSFQISFIVKFSVIVVFTSLLIGGILYYLTRSSTTVAIENTRVMAKSTANFILPSLSITIIVVSLFSALVVLILTLLVTHKISGPIFRLKREIELMQKGDLVRNFRIRDNDQLQGLSNSFSFMTDIFRDKIKELKDTYSSLSSYLRENSSRISASERDKINDLLNKIKNTLNFFKVS